MSTRPIFEPWVGNLYGTSVIDGFRLLVVGHSHYGRAADANTNITTQVVSRHIAGKPSLGFFTLWGSLLAHRTPYTTLGNPDVLNAVAFYNLLQSFAGDEHDSEPTKLQWDQSVAPFTSVLDEHQPHAVLALGIETWDKIRFEDGTQSVVEGREFDRVWIRPNNRRIAASPINHPRSHGFSPSKWTEPVVGLLARGINLCCDP